LYVQLLKALYGGVVSVFLCYEMFSGCSKEMEFKINPYESVIENNLISRNIAQWHCMLMT